MPVCLPTVTGPAHNSQARHTRSCSDFFPILLWPSPSYTSLPRRSRLEKMIKHLHYFDLLWRKRILKIVETVILSLDSITMLCDSTGGSAWPEPPDKPPIAKLLFWYLKVGDVSVWNIVYLHSFVQNSLKCQYYVFMFLIEFNDVTSIATGPFEVFWPFADLGKYIMIMTKVTFMKWYRDTFPSRRKKIVYRMELSVTQWDDPPF